MRHAILGPGGVGGLVGACLARAGDSVTLVGRPGDPKPPPARLQLESAFGNFSVALSCTSSVPPVDVVWITVKATQLDAALTSFPEGNSVGAIVPLLNGVDHVAMLRSRYGADRVIPATIAVESERVAPGHIVHRSPFARLNVLSSGRKLLQTTLQQLQQIGFTCQFVDSEPTLLWSKLVFLAPLALVSTAAGKTTGEIAADVTWRGKLESCVREVAAVARAEGATVDPEAVLSIIRSLPSHMRSSMQKDVEQGRIPELDAIGGPILRGADRHQLEVPVTRELVARVEPRTGQGR
jgi:2-dehydropantoate 2-reductase